MKRHARLSPSNHYHLRIDKASPFPHWSSAPAQHSSQTIVNNRPRQSAGKIDGVIDENFQMDTRNAGVGKEYQERRLPHVRLIF
ncbi:MAG TPA: hypothetical protein VGN10_11440 [Pyrinomonadaceae bacterium]